MSVPNIEFFQVKKFVYWIKFVKYMKLFEIQGTSCYDINVTFIRSPKDDLLKFVKSEFRLISSFPAFEKNCKVALQFHA